LPEGLNGLIDSRPGEQTVILIHEELTPDKKNKVLAHELGHYFLKHGTLIELQASGREADQEAGAAAEREADAVGMGLLCAVARGRLYYKTIRDGEAWKQQKIY